MNDCTACVMCGCCQQREPFSSVIFTASNIHNTEGLFISCLVLYMRTLYRCKQFQNLVLLCPFSSAVVSSRALALRRALIPELLAVSAGSVSQRIRRPPRRAHLSTNPQEIRAARSSTARWESQ